MPDIRYPHNAVPMQTFFLRGPDFLGVPSSIRTGGIWGSYIRDGRRSERRMCKESSSWVSGAAPRLGGIREEDPFFSKALLLSQPGALLDPGRIGAKEDFCFFSQPLPREHDITFVCAYEHEKKAEKNPVRPRERPMLNNRKRRLDPRFDREIRQTGARARPIVYFLRKEQPSVRRAFPPVGWHSTVVQPWQMTTVWA